MVFIVILFFIFHLTLQECLNKKVSITTDFVEDTTVVRLKTDTQQLLWHVAILRQEESELRFLCSGTIVGDSHVVTAASCVVNVSLRELRVVAGLTLVRSPSDSVENPHSVFIVTRKYYPYHRGDIIKEDLAILKLKNKATFKTPQLGTLQATDKFSKQCFTLGWGVSNRSSDSSRCQNPSFQDSINNLLNYAEQSKPILSRILDIRNLMGMTSMFIFQLSKMLNILPGLPQYGSISKYSQDPTCPLDDYSRIKAVRMTTKHPYQCLCHNTDRICLYSLGVDNIAHQLDIGSPVFCKLKRPKTRSKLIQQSSRKFVLAGIITSKETEEIHWLQYSSAVNMITATNVTTSTGFILAVIRDNN